MHFPFDIIYTRFYNMADKFTRLMIMKKKLDLAAGLVFAAATVILIVIFMTNDAFFDWAFARHHNVLSWYIRPLFIIPMVIFAFKKSYTGVFASIFALFTSMFWFPAPAEADPKVLEFLAFEMDYLKGEWTAPKIVISLAIPLFFVLLILAAWRRNRGLLVGVIVGAAVLKSIWSVVFGGESGISVLAPALAGLLICIGALWFYFRKARRSEKKE